MLALLLYRGGGGTQQQPPPAFYGSNAPSGGGGGGKRDWPPWKEDDTALIPLALLDPVEREARLEVAILAQTDANAAPFSASDGAPLIAAFKPPADDDDDEEAIFILLH